DIDVLRGQAANDELFGINADNEWHITGTNAGYVTGNGETYYFSGVENVFGGNQSDRFIFDIEITSVDPALTGGAITGLVDGDNSRHGDVTGAVNTIVGRNAINLWQVQSDSNGIKVYEVIDESTRIEYVSSITN